MQRLLLLGLNHTTAPLEVRERLAFGSGQGRAAVAAFRERHPAAEAVLLSTCNRVELYVGRHAHTSLGLDELVAFLAEFHDVPAAAFRDHLYHKAGRDAVEHLFTVACSLDSMVLGETQILGQVRDAYDAAREMQAAGALLNPLFQRAVAVGKQVMHETSLSEGRLSVASVAVDYAKRIFEHFGDKTILCVGAGKMASLVLQNFVGLSPGRLLVCNRDTTKAEALAAQFKGQAVPFDRLNNHLIAADIVVTSTGSAHPIITRKSFQPLLRLRRYRPIFLIDIAIPRDVESSVGDLDHVYLYNVDDLQQVVANTVAQRTGAIDAARAIVARHVDEFAAWHRQREMGPIIDRLSKRYHRVAKEELDRTVNKLSNVTPADRANLEDLVRRVVNKLLHNPIRTLRTSEGQHSGLTYLHAMEKLFDLEKAEEAEAAIPPEDPAAPDQGGQTSG
jgi:glutamyl-tRNA reductase